MKRIFLFGILLVFLSLTTQAARQEKDLNLMIVSLHHELVYNWQKTFKDKKTIKANILKIDTLIHHVNDKSKECALMVYSTKDEAFLDLVYASQTTQTELQDFPDETAP